MTPELRALTQAARAITGQAGAAGGFGGGGGGQAPLAEAGSYTVVLKVGDRELRQPLQVIRGPNAGG
jgi:hypothetical protein